MISNVQVANLTRSRGDWTCFCALTARVVAAVIDPAAERFTALDGSDLVDFVGVARVHWT